MVVKSGNVCGAQYANKAPADENQGFSNGGAHSFYQFICFQFPMLKEELKLADMEAEPEEFIRGIFLNAVLSTVLALIFLAVVFYAMKISVLLAIILAPALGICMFFYLKYYPNVRASARKNEIDRELIFCARHLLIAINAGMPLFDALVSVSRDYGEVSREIYKIVEQVSFGESMSIAIRDVVESNSSQYFRQIMLQIMNSLAAGGDVGEALESTITQISNEQLSKMQEYGQKLSPIVVFYMLFSIVIPSLGIVFVITIISFVGGIAASLNSWFLLLMFLLIALIQYIFITYIEASRPAFYL